MFGSLGAETSEGFVEEVALELVVKTGKGWRWVVAAGMGLCGGRSWGGGVPTLPPRQIAAAWPCPVLTNFVPWQPSQGASPGPRETL